MSPNQRKFTFLPWDKFKDLAPPGWLVKNILPEGGLALLFGASGCGKTFVALDLGLCVATGEKWHGHGATRSRVVYIAAEYTSSLKNRVAAWLQEQNREALDTFFFSKDAVQLHNNDEVTRFIDNLKSTLGQEPVSLIIFDTLARCFVGGDENSAQEMGMVIANVDRIREELGTAVLLIHHTTKDNESYRGSGSLEAGATTAMWVKPGAGKSLTIACRKQKDAEEFENLQLYRTQVFGSCVMRTAGGDALAALRALHELDGSATWEEWTTACERFGIPEGGSFDRARKRVVEELKWVRHDGGRYAITLAGAAALEAYQPPPTIGSRVDELPTTTRLLGAA
jgi:hypothetical protein